MTGQWPVLISASLTLLPDTVLPCVVSDVGMLVVSLTMIFHINMLL